MLCALASGGLAVELTLNLTHACNLGCSYCFAGEKTDRAMDPETGRKGLRLALDRAERGDRALDLAFFGGEPLLEADLLLTLADEARALADERRLRLRLSVTTNGTLLTPELAAALNARGFHVAVSLDGVPEAQDLT